MSEAQQPPQPALPLQDETQQARNHLSRYSNLTQQQLDAGISFGVSRTGVNSPDPYNLFIIDRQTGLPQMCGSNLIRFLIDLFGNTDLWGEINLCATNTPLRRLGATAPATRQFTMYRGNQGSVVVENIQDGTRDIVVYASMNQFLNNFPHQQPDRMHGRRTEAWV